MSDREAILHSLRRGLRRGPLSGEDLAAVERRLARPPRHSVPERARRGGDARLAQFIEMAEFAAASVDRAARWAELPAAVESFLMRHNLPVELVLAPDPRLTALAWDGGRLRVEARVPRDGDRIGLGRALAGIAETGTLLLCSGSTAPSTLNFLPDVHIVAVPAAAIVGGYEDAFEQLRRRGPLPRTVNLITGPSRSADIEQTLQLGAHGPVRLHIVLIDD